MLSATALRARSRCRLTFAERRKCRPSNLRILTTGRITCVDIKSEARGSYLAVCNHCGKGQDEPWKTSMARMVGHPSGDRNDVAKCKQIRDAERATLLPAYQTAS